MYKVLGYILLAIGLPCCLFFLKFYGTGIPLRGLWFVLSIFTIIAGSAFIVRARLKTHKQAYDVQLKQVEHLKCTGKKVKVTLSNAEVKTRTYQAEVSPERLATRIEMIDALYDSNRN